MSGDINHRCPSAPTTPGDAGETTDFEPESVRYLHRSNSNDVLPDEETSLPRLVEQNSQIGDGDAVRTEDNSLIQAPQNLDEPRSETVTRSRKKERRHKPAVTHNSSMLASITPINQQSEMVCVSERACTELHDQNQSQGPAPAIDEEHPAKQEHETAPQNAEPFLILSYFEEGPVGGHIEHKAPIWPDPDEEMLAQSMAKVWQDFVNATVIISQTSSLSTQFTISQDTTPEILKAAFKASLRMLVNEFERNKCSELGQVQARPFRISDAATAKPRLDTRDAELDQAWQTIVWLKEEKHDLERQVSIERERCSLRVQNIEQRYLQVRSELEEKSQIVLFYEQKLWEISQEREKTRNFPGATHFHSFSQQRAADSPAFLVSTVASILNTPSQNTVTMQNWWYQQQHEMRNKNGLYIQDRIGRSELHLEGSLVQAREPLKFSSLPEDKSVSPVVQPPLGRIPQITGNVLPPVSQTKHRTRKPYRLRVSTIQTSTANEMRALQPLSSSHSDLSLTTSEREASACDGWRKSSFFDDRVITCVDSHAPLQHRSSQGQYFQQYNENLREPFELMERPRLLSVVDQWQSRQAITFESDDIAKLYANCTESTPAIPENHNMNYCKCPVSVPYGIMVRLCDEIEFNNEYGPPMLPLQPGKQLHLAHTLPQLDKNSPLVWCARSGEGIRGLVVDSIIQRHTEPLLSPYPNWQPNQNPQTCCCERKLCFTGTAIVSPDSYVDENCLELADRQRVDVAHYSKDKRLVCLRNPVNGRTAQVPSSHVRILREPVRSQAIEGEPPQINYWLQLTPRLADHEMQGDLETDLIPITPQTRLRNMYSCGARTQFEQDGELNPHGWMWEEMALRDAVHRPYDKECVFCLDGARYIRLGEWSALPQAYRSLMPPNAVARSRNRKRRAASVGDLGWCEENTTSSADIRAPAVRDLDQPLHRRTICTSKDFEGCRRRLVYRKISGKWCFTTTLENEKIYLGQMSFKDDNIYFDISAYEAILRAKEDPGDNNFCQNNRHAARYLTAGLSQVVASLCQKHKKIAKLITDWDVDPKSTEPAPKGMAPGEQNVREILIRIAQFERQGETKAASKLLLALQRQEGWYIVCRIRGDKTNKMPASSGLDAGDYVHLLASCNRSDVIVERVTDARGAGFGGDKRRVVCHSTCIDLASAKLMVAVLKDECYLPQQRYGSGTRAFALRPDFERTGSWVLVLPNGEMLVVDVRRFEIVEQPDEWQSLRAMHRIDEQGSDKDETTGGTSGSGDQVTVSCDFMLEKGSVSLSPRDSSYGHFPFSFTESVVQGARSRDISPRNPQQLKMMRSEFNSDNETSEITRPAAVDASVQNGRIITKMEAATEEQALELPTGLTQHGSVKPQSMGHGVGQEDSQAAVQTRVRRGTSDWFVDQGQDWGVSIILGLVWLVLFAVTSRQWTAWTGANAIYSTREGVMQARWGGGVHWTVLDRLRYEALKRLGGYDSF